MEQGASRNCGTVRCQVHNRRGVRMPYRYKHSSRRPPLVKNWPNHQGPAPVPSRPLNRHIGRPVRWEHRQQKDTSHTETPSHSCRYQKCRLERSDHPLSAHQLHRRPVRLPSVHPRREVGLDISARRWRWPGATWIRQRTMRRPIPSWSRKGSQRRWKDLQLRTEDGPGMRMKSKEHAKVNPRSMDGDKQICSVP